MKTAYFDCVCGAGGDMIVASLIDAGADADSLRQSVSRLGLTGYSISIDPVRRQGFAAKRFQVTLDGSAPQPHRHLGDIAEILRTSTLPELVCRRAIRVFERLAETEARVHGIGVEQVHFHEVGAVDAIVDVVGAVSALHQLGVDRVICSPIPTGSGTVVCDHGILPVPTPATADLLRGVPLVATDEQGELITPTAAAVLTTLADGFGPLPTMTIDAIGYGAGARDDTNRPNLLRVLIGEATPDGDADEIAVLETSLDDASAEVIAHCTERLWAEGALDVYTVPVHMKKSRSGVVLTVLCEPDRATALERTVFAETPTFGIRRHNVRRVKLRRRHETVSTSFGDIRIKIGEHDGIVTASPEYEDCRAAAGRHHVALREVMAAAGTAWANRGCSDASQPAERSQNRGAESSTESSAPS